MPYDSICFNFPVLWNKNDFHIRLWDYYISVITYSVHVAVPTLLYMKKRLVFLVNSMNISVLSFYIAFYDRNKLCLHVSTPIYIYYL